MECAFQTIRRDPSLEVIDSPDVSLPDRKHLEESFEEIKSSSQMFNGQILMVDTIDLVVPALTVYPAKYAWKLATEKSDSIRKMSRGPLSVMVVIQAGDKVLWQRRTHEITDGFMWTLSVSGFADTGVSLLRCAESRVQKELGLRLESFRLTPLAVMIFEAPEGVKVIYRAELDEGAAFELDSSQVSDILWAPVDDPPDILHPASEQVARRILETV